MKKYWEGNNWLSIKTSSKEEFLKKLKKFSTDKKQIVKLITDNKKYLISVVSQEVEWYLSILRLHNFRDEGWSHREYFEDKCDKYSIGDKITTQE